MSENKTNKSFYQKWWFWLIVAVVVVGVFGGSSQEDTAKDNKPTTEQTTKEDKNVKNDNKLKSEYKVGETAEHKGLSLAVKEVKWIPANEYSSLKNGQEFCIVKVEMKNNGDSEKQYDSYSFKLNDNGNKTGFDAFPISVTDEFKQYEDNRLESGTLAKGASVEGYLIGAANPNDSVFLEYTGNMFSNETKVKFNLK